MLAETDPEAARVEFQAGLEVVDGLDLFVAESNLRRELIPVLMRIDPDAAVLAAAEFLKRCDERNDTGQVNNGLACLVTILHDVGASELSAETAGHVGRPLLAPSSAVQFRDTEHALSELLGDDYEARLGIGRNRSTRELVASILEVLSSNA